MLSTGLVAAVPPPAAASAQPDAETAALLSAVQRFTTASGGLATLGPMGEQLPLAGLVPGGEDALGLGDLFQVAVHDKLKDLTSLDDLQDEYEVPGPRAGRLLAEASTQGQTRHLDLTLEIARTVAGRPISVSSSRPKVSLTTSGGVDVTLKLTAKLPFAYDPATKSAWLGKDAAVTVRAEGRLAAGAKPAAAFGILGVDLSPDSALSFAAEFAATAADPDGNGRLDLSELGSEGLFGFTRKGSATAKLRVTAQPFAGAQVEGATAAIDVSWPDLATGGPAVSVTQADLDRLNRFQTLTPKDLLDGLTHLANAVTAAQRARWDGQGDLDLPFMRGSLADAVQVSEAIHAFAAASVDRNTGQPTFTSVQDLFAALGQARGLPGGAIIKVADAGYDDAAKKIAFTLVVDRTVNPAPEPLNPAGQTTGGTGAGVTYTAKTLKHTGQKWTPGQFTGRTVTAGASSGIVADNTADTVTLADDGWRGGVPAAGAPYRISASDPMIGQVSFGGAFKDAAGLDRANATAALAGVMRGYHASATVVLDLSDPVTGQGCAQRPDGQGKACPYRHANADGSATVVNELPRAADRIMLRTGRDLFGARVSVLSPVNVNAVAGYLGVQITGDLTMGSGDGGDLVKVGLKDLGDVPLTRLFERLASKPGDVLTSQVDASARARLTLGVPGLADFFGGKVSGEIEMPDISEPGTVHLRGFDQIGKVKDFAFDPGNPQALFGALVKSLGAVATYLDRVEGGGEVMNTKLPLLGRSLSDLVAAEEMGAGPGVVYGDGACGNDNAYLTDPSRTFTQAHLGRRVAVGTRVLTVATACGEHTLSFTEKFGGSVPEAGAAYALRSPLRDAIDRLTAAPPDTVQALVAELNKALGGQVRIGYEDGALRLALAYDKKAAVQEPLRFSFGESGLVAAKGSATLDAAVEGEIRLGLRVALKRDFDLARDLLIETDSGLDLQARAQLDGSVQADVGPLPLAIGKDGDDPLQARLGYGVSLRYGGEQQDAVTAGAFFAGLDLALNETSDPVACDRDPHRDDTDLALCAVLPAYLNGAPLTADGKHALVLRLPRSAPLAEMFDLTKKLPGDVNRLELPSFDFSALPPGLELDWTNLGDGIDRYLTTLETGMRMASNQGRLPMVGADLQQGADFVGAKRQEIKAAIGKLPNGGKVPTGGDLRQWYNDELAPKVGPGAQPVITCVQAPVPDPAKPEACDAAKGGELTGIAFKVSVGKGDVDPQQGCVKDCLGVERPLDIGVPGLALRQGAGKGVRAELGWHAEVMAGLDRTSGFYLDAGEANRPRATVGVNVSLPDEINARLAILDVRLKNREQNAPDLFAGAFTIGLKPVGRIGLHQLADAADLVETSLHAKVAVDWRFQVTAGSAMFPGLFGDFDLDWDLTKGGSPDPANLDIAFNNVNLEAGDFFRSVLGPVVTQVKKITDPVKPVIDQLYAPIPVLSDLSKAAGGGEVNLMTIAKKYNTVAGGGTTKFIERMIEVGRLVTALPDCQGELHVPIGSFTVAGDRALNTENSPDVADSLIKDVAPATDDLFAALDQGASSCAKSAAAQGPMEHSAKAGFSFPVLQNAGRSIFSLLMGKDVELVAFDSGPLRLGFSYSQSFGPVWSPPPIMVVISGTAGIEAHIRAGFDTYGIRKAIEQRRLDLQVLDSLYLKTTDDQGKPLPAITLTGRLEAGAAVDVVLVKAGVSGGIFLTVAMNWLDPTNDGKFRFHEFAGVLLRNPLCLFSVDGELKVYLKAWVEVGISIFKKRFDWTIVEAKLLDFSARPKCDEDPPKLATVDGDALVLHVGAMRKARGGSTAKPGDEPEQWTVSQLPADEGFVVSALGVREEHRAAGLDRVLADGRGAKGALRLVFQGYGDDTAGPHPFSRTVVAFGGDGDDLIMAGAGRNVVDGGKGDDQITSGDAYDGAAAVVAGGPGDDYLTLGGAGGWAAGDGRLTPATRKVGDVEVADWPDAGLPGAPAEDSGDAPAGGSGNGLPGAPADGADDGADRIAAGLGANRLWGNGGDDTIAVASDSPLAATDPSPRFRAQPSLLVGGPGADTLTGGSAADEIHTGPQEKFGRDEAGPDDEGPNYVDTGAGADEVYGGKAADLVAGHSAPGETTSIVGGGGDDVLAGGHGKDDISGGPGDDWVIAEPSDVGEAQGRDDFGPARQVRHLPLPAGVQPSAKRLSGGDGHDHIVGGDGGATVFGDRRRDEPCEEHDGDADGRDLVIGGAGEETVSAGGGADRVEAGGGQDRVCGERGDDRLSGGSGDDQVAGGSGADTALGDDGADEVTGGPGDDTLYGGAHDDTVAGEPGQDSAFGGDGDDLIIGGTRTAGKDDQGDALYGDAGADKLIGDNGDAGGPFDLDGTPQDAGAADTLHGGDGPDTAFGGIGADEVHGDAGDDHLEGGVGGDRVLGGAGEDELVGGAAGPHPDGGDTLLGGEGPDVIAGDNAILSTATPSPSGSDPATQVAARPGQTATHQVKLLAGGSGPDVADGGAGNDALFGQAGHDRLRGQADHDYAEGGAGVDWLEGDHGNDDLVGGTHTTAADTTAAENTRTDDTPGTPDALYGGPGDDAIAGDNALITLTGTPTRATLRQGSTNTPMTPRAITLLPTDPGDDHISGGSGVDVLWGQNGDDHISGGGHGDYAEGGPGADQIRGDLPLSANSTRTPTHPFTDPGWRGEAGGPEDLEGDNTPGQDDLIGGSSKQSADDESDAIEGNGAADVLLGDNGSLVRTMTGNTEKIYTERYPAGQAPADATRVRSHDPSTPGGGSTRFCTQAQPTCEPTGSYGADHLFGDEGDDGLWGQDGDDELDGGAGDDDLFGELGDDELNGGAGEDAMLGDRGGVVSERIDAADAQRLGFTVSLNAPPKETYRGFQAGTYDRRTDLLHDADGDAWVSAALPHDGFAKGGDDRMRGGPGRDSIHGGAGDDLVNGDSGGDEVFGGDGADVIWGGKGCDPVLDAATPDCLSGGAFDPAARGSGDRFVDHVFGGAGADLLDYNPRGSYPGSCAPGKKPDGELTTVVDPCAWFRMTGKDNAATADDQHHQGVDWQYGGADRDVLQGDRTANGPNPGDKMIDWNGNFNLYTHCGPANGGHNIVRQHSPAMLDFLAKVAWGAGAGRSAGDPSGSREVAVPPGDSGSPYPTSPGHFDSPVACAG
ncbi:calcium-binding protein [Nonomuraea sp. PA05]|uniref:calcium-binding protein n=1 Tax=Nonomuraea sp. PA05 TaxID=2604466 RepID=UPI0011D93D4D|nr:calcium-binding protein [Nonomuraea sp. PA05]TYB57633.1 calcium-binding protein [Nonomuraea sp. PA05]